MNRFLSALLCACVLSVCCAWAESTPAAAEQFVVAAESPGKFVVAEQATSPKAPQPANVLAVSPPACEADGRCRECEAAGYDADGRKRSTACRCGADCPCEAGECGDGNCPALRPSSGGCQSCQAGRARPTTPRARRAATRRFLLPRLFGRFRGGCRSCR